MSNQGQSDVNRVPNRCQPSANPMSIHCQSRSNPVSMHCQSGANRFSNPTSTNCQSANPVSIQRRSRATNPIRSQSAANPIPIQCQSSSINSMPIYQSNANQLLIHSNLPIHHQSTNILPILGQSANPSPSCQSITNPRIRCKSWTNLQIHHRSANPMPVLDQSINLTQIQKYKTNPMPICQSNANIQPIQKYNTNPLPIPETNANTSIQSQSPNPLPIQQSSTNRPIRFQSIAITPIRTPHGPCLPMHQTCLSAPNNRNRNDLRLAADWHKSRQTGCRTTRTDPVPIRSQTSANPMPIHYQSVNPMPILANLGSTRTDISQRPDGTSTIGIRLVSARDERDARPATIFVHSANPPVLDQSNANLPIQFQSDNS